MRCTRPPPHPPPPPPPPYWHAGRRAHSQRALSKPSAVQQSAKRLTAPPPRVRACHCHTSAPASPSNLLPGSNACAAQPKPHHAAPYSAAPSKQRACSAWPALPQCIRARPHTSLRSRRMTAWKSSFGAPAWTTGQAALCFSKARDSDAGTTTCMHARMHAHAHACMHMRMHTSACMHACTRAPPVAALTWSSRLMHITVHHWLPVGQRHVVCRLGWRSQVLPPGGLSAIVPAAAHDCCCTRRLDELLGLSRRLFLYVTLRYLIDEVAHQCDCVSSLHAQLQLCICLLPHCMRMRFLTTNLESVSSLSSIPSRCCFLQG